MKRRRIKVKGRSAVYHCMSRTVNGEHLWDDVSKGVMSKQLWQVAEFCGVEVLTYCIMSNHFHVLLRVPDRDTVEVSDDELVRRLRALYDAPTRAQQVRMDAQEYQLRAGGEEAMRVRDYLLSRMHDVSEFMKTLKQRFSIWFNQNHDRFGTHWAERYQSVLVEGDSVALLTTALYIDLNPVRAGLVESPEHYPHCGFADACRGEKRLYAGLRRVLSILLPRDPVDDARLLQLYRERLLGRATLGRKRGKGGHRISREAARELVEAGTEPTPLHIELLSKCSSLTQGLVLGSAPFVAENLGGTGKKPVAVGLASMEGLHIGKRLQTPGEA